MLLVSTRWARRSMTASPGRPILRHTHHERPNTGVGNTELLTDSMLAPSISAPRAAVGVTSAWAYSAVTWNSLVLPPFITKVTV